MKKLITVFVAIAITVGAYAQVDANRKTNNSGTIQNQDKNKSGVIQNQDKSKAGTIQDQDKSKAGTIQNRDNDNQNPNLQINSTDKSDGYVMKNGKLMQVKNGQSTLLDREMTLSNGTKIMTDGSYTDKNGSKRMWKEGERMDMSGEMTSIETNKDKNMYLLRDSTKKKDK